MRPAILATKQSERGTIRLEQHAPDLWWVTFPPNRLWARRVTNGYLTAEAAWAAFRHSS